MSWEQLLLLVVVVFGLWGITELQKISDRLSLTIAELKGIRSGINELNHSVDMIRRGK